jgi:DNA-binding transcriptional LysR family regulator
VRLLERDRRSVTLTAAGRQLLEDAVPLLASADAARRRVQRAARGGKSLVVGFRAGITPAETVRRFRAAEPGAEVEMRRLEWDDQEEAVLGGRVDVAYVRRPIDPRGLRLVPLYKERRLAALNVDHPLAGRAAITEADLAGETHLRYLEPVKTGPGRTTILRGVEEKLEYLVAGKGYLLLPYSATRHYTRPDIVYVPVTDAAPDEVMLAIETSRRSKLLSAFVEAAKAVAAADPDVLALEPAAA